ncbi:metal ABC transporter ATP-binding protein [Actinomyces slackii]|uniref:Lipopolysaccharide export system ATP-binding protein LptB n=1 Tax=Actinomyces slackii TaxID=52774 RepID=A0A448KCH2_9ACTO|nr:metal ABC transporter ATP-binding protein [Actinomyces slackii]VEG74602.1 Lipopolysaccharide export system ATP-binding protein LptB [Actinomyces slackii]
MLEVRGLSVRYGPLLALDDASLEVLPGRICGLVGANGSGKSTLFNAVMGLVAPEAGTIIIDGTPGAIARRRGVVGYVPQEDAVDRDFPISVGEVVTTGRYGHMGPLRRPSRADRQAVEAAMERTGIDGLSRRQIGELSGGQRKRVFVARAIAQGARLLLLDEPFAGVDRVSEAAIVGLLRELAAEGCAVLVSTHDLGSLRELADDAVLLAGRVLAAGPIEQVLTPQAIAHAFGAEAAAGEGMLR